MTHSRRKICFQKLVTRRRVTAQTTSIYLRASAYSVAWTSGRCSKANIRMWARKKSSASSARVHRRGNGGGDGWTWTAPHNACSEAPAHRRASARRSHPQDGTLSLQVAMGWRRRTPATQRKRSCSRSRRRQKWARRSDCRQRLAAGSQPCRRWRYGCRRARSNWRQQPAWAAGCRAPRGTRARLRPSQPTAPAAASRLWAGWVQWAARAELTGRLRCCSCCWGPRCQWKSDPCLVRWCLCLTLVHLSAGMQVLQVCI